MRTIQTSLRHPSRFASRAALVVALGLAGCAIAPSNADAQIHVSIQIPGVRFEAAPPLVLVAPGVYIVPEHREEVFFSAGWYWARHHDRWYHASDWSGAWVVADPVVVPVWLRHAPRGAYVHYRPGHSARWLRGGPAHVRAPRVRGQDHWQEHPRRGIAEKHAWKLEKHARKEQKHRAKEAWKDERRYEKALRKAHHRYEKETWNDDVPRTREHRGKHHLR